MDSTPTDELAAWCLLARAPGIGCRTLNDLAATGRTAVDLVARPPQSLPAQARAWLADPDRAGVDADMRWLEQPNHHLLRITDPAYPPLLHETPDPPALLFLHGDPDLLALPQLAIVGSRSPTVGGRQTAGDFASFAAAAGLVVASGLADGIDTASHEGALSAGGLTLAVMGTGPDRIYPARNRELAHRIVGEGLLVTEFPTGTQPLAGNFPRRNRILAGLALGTLVVEAALKSGSLITARIAAEQGREVFAIPSSIHNPLARGCHALIRQGAKLVETGEHLLEDLAPLLAGFDLGPAPSAGPRARGPAEAVDPAHARVLEAMGFDPVTTDELVARTDFPAAEVSSILLLLELEGHVSSCGGGKFTRVGASNA
jgi:DNA processing protein